MTTYVFLCKEQEIAVWFGLFFFLFVWISPERESSNVYHVGRTDGGKLELMSYIQQVSSYLPLLGGVSASDMIDIGVQYPFWGIQLNVSWYVQTQLQESASLAHWYRPHYQSGSSTYRAGNFLTILGYATTEAKEKCNEYKPL